MPHSERKRTATHVSFPPQEKTSGQVIVIAIAYLLESIESTILDKGDLMCSLLTNHRYASRKVRQCGMLFVLLLLSAIMANAQCAYPPYPAFFSSQTSIGGGFYAMTSLNDGNPFGEYTFVACGWFWHEDMGYEYFTSDGSVGVYLYDFLSGHELWTDVNNFPYLYDFNLGNWLWWEPLATPSGGHYYTSSPRIFYNTTKGFWDIIDEPTWTSINTSGTWKQYQFVSTSQPVEHFNTNPPTAPDTYLTFPSSNLGQQTVTYTNSGGTFTPLTTTECTLPTGASGSSQTPLPPWWWISSSVRSFYCPTSPSQSGGYISGPADLTGCTIYRLASNGYRTASMSGVKGFELSGGFDGSTGILGQSLLEAVFFHQQNCWSGGPEYGFTRDNVANTFAFYWSTNSNCGAYPNTFCLNGQYSAGSPVYEDYSTYNSGTDIAPYISQSISLPSGDNYIYHAYIFQDVDSRYKFKVEVLNSDRSTYSGQTLIVDPNTDGSCSPYKDGPCTTIANWYPIDTLYGATGYLTIGLVRADTGNVQSPAVPPTITVANISVGQ